MAKAADQWGDDARTVRGQFPSSPITRELMSDALDEGYIIARMARTFGMRLGTCKVQSPLSASGWARFIAPAIRGSAARSPFEVPILMLRSNTTTVATISLLLLVALVPASSAQRDPELERQARNLTGAVFAIDHYRGLNWIHHSGEWVGYRAALSHFPDQHFSTLVTCNCVGSMNPMGMAKRVADLYLEEEFTRAEKTTSAQTASSLPATTLKRYVGTYWSENNGALRKFQIRDDKLVMVAPGMTYDLRPLGGGQFEALEPDSEHWDKYTFRTSRSGQEFEVEAWEGGAPAIYRAVKGSPLEASRLKESPAHIRMMNCAPHGPLSRTMASSSGNSG